MKNNHLKLSLFAGVIVVLTLIVSMVWSVQVARAASTLNVDNTSAICNDTTGDPYCTIGAAVNAALDGDAINVSQGIYQEQLVITKSIQLVGAGAGLSIVSAPATLPPSSNATSSIVLVSGSGVDMEITGFTITGPGPSGCGSIRTGIYVYDGANANIHHNTIQDIRDSTFSGCQNGVAIAIGRQYWSTSGTAVISNNTIVGYQKGGILVDNTGSNATITNNIVTGVGTTSIIAQNGIQISRGGTATMSGNTITGNSFHLEGSPWDWGSAGILLYQSGAIAMSGGNVIADNDQNLYVDSTSAATFSAELIGPSTGPLDWGYDVINLTTLELDFTDATFVGAADNDEIEGRVWHVVDDPTVGLVTWTNPVVQSGLTVKVQDSLGNPVEGAVITYAVGSPNAGWQTFGTTAADGTISRSDLTVGTNYHFYASYNASTSTSQALVFDGDDEVVFETVLVKAKVETCLGGAIEGAAVTYGSVNGGFLSFGTTGSDGFVSKELFPGYDRTFYASVNHTSSALQTATVVEQGDPLVTFETTKVAINYSGSVNHGSANGGWYPFTKPAMEMFAGARTFLINGTQVAATVPECDFSTGDLTVKFSGIGSVHTYLKKSDGVNGVANGVQVASLTWKNDEAVFADVPNDVYDIVVVKGAQTKIVDNVIVLGDKTVEGLVSTLTVEFPGIGSVHAYAKMPDGIAGVAGGGGVEERTWKNDQAELIVLKGTYDVLVVKGAKNYVVDNVDCTGETCLVNGIVATLTVKFPGIGSVHTYARMPNGGGAVEERTWKNDQSEMVVLKGVYDVSVVKGAKTYIVEDVDCTGNTCLVDGIVATLTVKFPGIGSVHTYAKMPDGAAGVAGGSGVEERTWKNDQSEMVVLKGTYDVQVVKGAKTYVVDNVDCTGASCQVDGIVATLTVKFPGIGSVHTYAKMPDGVANTAGGGGVEERTWKNDQSEMVVLKGMYDVSVVKGAKTYVADDVDCSGDTCLVEGIVATLTIKYPGMTGIHNYVKMPDAISNSATGGAVEERTWQNNESVMTVLRGFYDVLIVKGSASFIYDDVDCTALTCTLDKASLTVKFPGITSVHTYVRKSDNVAGTATGAQVASQTYKADQAVFADLPNGFYDVIVVKGAQTKVIDNVTVLGGWATVDKIVATLTVEFPGIAGVHTYAKVNDGVAGTAAGGSVEDRTYKTDETSMTVLKSTYDVIVVKGAKQKVIDAVDCTGETCLVENIVATLTVKFPGIAGVHAYAKVNDGVVGTATGGSVEDRTYKTDETSMTVLKSTYDVIVVKGAKQKVIDAVDCTGNTCVVENIVATLTVKFPGIISVHTYAKVDDGVAGTAAGGSVEERTYKNNETSMVVLKGTYDVIVVKGAKQKVVDTVDCTGNTCVVENIVATLTVKFPGLSSVHTYVKVNDGVVGTAAGGSVDERTYKTNKVSIVVLKSTYDVVVIKGSKQVIVDAVDCTGDTCVIENILAALTAKFPASGLFAYNNKERR